MLDSPQPPKPMQESKAKDTRRARYFLYVIGGLLVVIGMALETVPSLADVTTSKGARACALFGAIVLAIGRFAPDRFVRRCEQLLTGWL